MGLLESRRCAASALVLFLATSVSLAAPAGDVKRGEALYEVCGACHGDHGHGEDRMAVPAIAGQDGAYLLRQLHNFSQGIRGALPADATGNQMAAIMKFVSAEKDWTDIVTYIRTMPAATPKVTLKGDRRHGEQIFATCAACHGASGDGNPALSAPRLAGLQDWYIVAQLQKFRTGLRGSQAADTVGARMKAASAVLQSDADLSDVAAYVATMSGGGNVNRAATQ